MNITEQQHVLNMQLFIYLNVKICVLQSAITCFNFASMSRSFTALMHTSWKMHTTLENSFI